MKNNKIKRVISAMLASVMLLGISVTANAVSGGAGSDNHVHSYKNKKNYYYSSIEGTHTYLVSNKINEDGSIEPTYGTCYKVRYYYDYIWTCIFCEDSYTEPGSMEIRHMQCGAPIEQPK